MRLITMRGKNSLFVLQLLLGCFVLALQFGPISGWTTTTATSIMSSSRATLRMCPQPPQRPFSLPMKRPAFLLFMSTGGENGEELQALFNQQCNKDGLMTKEMLRKIPTISELLDDGDLMSEELDDIWEAAPKFPDVKDKMELIDVDSFVQIYRDIDDLFEEEEDDDDEEEGKGAKQKMETAGTTAKVPEVDAVSEDSSETSEIRTGDEEEQELESTFQTICNENGLVSKEDVLQWVEIDKLMQEGLLGQDEFDELWEKTRKSPGSSNQLLDVEGFLSFNVALDDLFVFEDDEGDDEGVFGDEEDGASELSSAPPKDMVVGDDLPPGVLFAALANDDSLVGMKELKRWSNLQEMLAEEELLPLELQNIFDDVSKAPGTDDMLDEAGFTALWKAIDSLFEELDFEEDDTSSSSSLEAAQKEGKETLLALLSELNSDEDRLPCGLESTAAEELRIKQVVTALEENPSNLVQQKRGNIDTMDLAGDWELLYSSSSAMKYNKGLSGLGGSVPNGKFGGLVQKLMSTKYLSDVEYVERINVTPSTASFDVRVTGDWDLRRSVSLFTGAPSTVLTVEPAAVKYGPTSTKADHWKSLGPLNMLDVTYLDKDLRVMRGNTSTDSIFIFRKTSS